MKKTNILYCGMADDILTPILLAPDFDTLFAIDIFDGAFTPECSSKWEDQKNEILMLLEDGHDQNSWHLKVYKEHHPNWPITKLNGKCTILSNIDDGKCWHVQFLYENQQRALLYYHHRDFYKTWPSDVKDINHLMSMGAVFMRDKYEPKFVNIPKFFNCIKERCDLGCLYYESFNHFVENNGEYAYKVKYRKIKKRNNVILVNPLLRELDAYFIHQYS